MQAFALPHGVSLQATDLNAVVEATISLLGPPRRSLVCIRTELGRVRPRKATRTRCKRCSATSAPTPLPPCPAAEC